MNVEAVYDLERLSALRDALDTLDIASPPTAFRSLLGAGAELYFVVGMDKLLQILDPRYYQNRDAAMRQLFALASLIVGSRGDLDQEDCARLLDQPENRAYRPFTHFLPLQAA